MISADDNYCLLRYMNFCTILKPDFFVQLVQPTRLLLEYVGEVYEERLYDRNDGDVWRNEKFNLGLEFPNVKQLFCYDSLLIQLPYYIDGDVKLTQSMAILRYIADKHNMCKLKYHNLYSQWVVVPKNVQKFLCLREPFWISDLVFQKLHIIKNL